MSVLKQYVGGAWVPVLVGQEELLIVSSTTPLDAGEGALWLDPDATTSGVGVIKQMQSGLWVDVLRFDASEPPLPGGGTTAQYLRGDKTWQTLNPTAVGAAAASHTHGIADLPVAASGTSSSTLLVRADDSRLSNARTPSGTAGGDLSGSYPNPDVREVSVFDTRAVDDLPQAYSKAVRYDFKQCATVGISDGSTYCAVLYLRHYSDTSAGRPMRIAYTDSGNTYQQFATATATNTWGAWQQIGKAGQPGIFGDDSRLTNARTPTAHTHLIADLPVAASGTSSSTSLVRADDSRLSDARTPVAHTHTKSQITDLGTIGTAAALNVAASGNAASTEVVKGNDTRLTDARTPVAHVHAIADLPVATSGTSNSTQVVRADDARLSDARTPTAHASTHATGGSDPITPAAIGAATTAHTHTKSQITDLGTIGTAAAKDAPASGDATSTQVVLGSDTRLTNARTPVAHAHLIADLPVATSGTSSSTQLVRADDSRLSDARTPVAHVHAIADLPVAASGTSSSTQLVRADDSRLSNARTPVAHTHTLLDLPDAWIKRAVKAASTANVAIPPGGTTLSMDGITLANGDRVLLKNQTSTAQNGIYVVGGIGTSVTLTRDADSDIVTELAGGTVSIDQGTQGGQIWSTTLKTTDTLGTTAMTWYRILDTSLLAASGTTVAGTVVQANDARLSDARTPVAHTHATTDVTSGRFADARMPARLDAGVSANSIANADTATSTGFYYLNPAPTLPNTTAVATPDVALIVAAYSTVWVTQFARDWRTNRTWVRNCNNGVWGSWLELVRGDDSRLTDARTPVAHVHAIADLPVATSGTSSSTQVVRADDSRLSNARTPTAHSHPVTDITATGTASASTFLRGDGSWATPGSAAIPSDAVLTGSPTLGDTNASVVKNKGVVLDTGTLTTVESYTNGLLTQVLEKNGGTTIKTTTLNYTGTDLTSVVEVAGGTTVTTTLTYTGGVLTGTSKTVV